MAGSTNVVFGVHSNLPKGKNSIIFGSVDKTISNRRVRLLAEDKKRPGIFYTLDDLSNKKLTLQQASKVLKKNFDEGDFLTGDTFYVEISDKNGKVKSIKLSASKSASKNAIRSSSGIAEYTFTL